MAGRKPIQAAESKETPANTELIKQDFESMNQLAAIQKNNDELFHFGGLIGRLETFDFVSSISANASLTIFEQCKQTDIWKLIINTSTNQKFQSLDEFCKEKLGKSYKRLQEVLKNRNLVGLEAFEQAEKLGLGQRDFNLIKTLPAPEQEQIKNALKEESSKEDVLQTLQELAAKHAKEVIDLKAESAAQAKLLESKNSTLEAVTADRDKYKAKTKLLEKMTPDQRLVELKKEVEAFSRDAQGLIKGQLRQSILALLKESAEPVYMAGLIGQLQVELNALREEFDLPDVSNAADLELASEVAQWANDAN